MTTKMLSEARINAVYDYLYEIMYSDRSEFRQTGALLTGGLRMTCQTL